MLLTGIGQKVSSLGFDIFDISLGKVNVYIYIYIYISLGMLVPNNRDRQGKLWLPKKQKTALKTTLQ